MSTVIAKVKKIIARLLQFAAALWPVVILTPAALAQPDMASWDRMIEELYQNDSILIRDSRRPAREEAPETEKDNKADEKERAAKKEKAKTEKQLRRERKKNTKKLLKAVKRGDIEKVKEYVLKKADVNYTRKNGETLLHIAAANGYPHIARILIAHGADIHAETVKGWTPLHHAARFGHIELVRQLMSKGGNMYLANSDGKNPYALAKQLHHEEVIRFFQIWRKYH